MEHKKPIQHNPGTFHFRCGCGNVVTFARTSKTYTLLVKRELPMPRVLTGVCPFCGQRYWQGSTRL